jgi:hypothetical protein
LELFASSSGDIGTLASYIFLSRRMFKVASLRSEMRTRIRVLGYIVAE